MATFDTPPNGAGVHTRSRYQKKKGRGWKIPREVSKTAAPTKLYPSVLGGGGGGVGGGGGGGGSAGTLVAPQENLPWKRGLPT